MVNFRNITDLPVAESTEGLNLIVNDNGSAKQIPANAVGAQADWNVTDETDPAFIKNRPNTAASWNDLTDKPFYEETNITDIFVDEEFILEYEEPSANVFKSKTQYNLVEGVVYNLIINGVAYDNIMIASGNIYVGEYSIRNGVSEIWINAPVGTPNLKVSLAVKNTTLKQLDEKFIPYSVKSGVYIVNVTNSPPPGEGDRIKDALLNGKTVYIFDGTFYFSVSAFDITTDTVGDTYLRIHTSVRATNATTLEGKIKTWTFLIAP